MKSKTISISLGLVLCTLSQLTMAWGNHYGHYTLTSEAVDIKAVPKNYKLAKMQLALQQKVQNEGYPDEAMLQEMFSTKLKDQLEKQGKYSENGVDLTINMDYRRTFVGDELGIASKSYGASRCFYEATLSYQNTPFATFKDEPMTNTSIMDNQKAIFTNMGKIATQLTLSGDATAEEKDIDLCAKRIIERLPK